MPPSRRRATRRRAGRVVRARAPQLRRGTPDRTPISPCQPEIGEVPIDALQQVVEGLAHHHL